MVKTHENSRFSLLSLTEIVSSYDVILQYEHTNSKFTESQKDVYLCEVVPRGLYHPEKNAIDVAAELVRVNKERDRLQRKVDQLAKFNRDLDSVITRMKEEAGGAK
jgi:hypothetical protein